MGVLGTGGSGLAGTLAALLVGARNGLYGLRLAPVLQVSGARRFAAAHLVIDETTAMTVAESDPRAGRLICQMRTRARITSSRSAASASRWSRTPRRRARWR